MFRYVASLAVVLLAASMTSAIAINVQEIAVSTSKGIRLERNDPTRIPLVDAASRAGEPRHLFQIPTPRGNTQTYLVLRDIFADAPPGVGYDVYIDLPAGRTPGGRSDMHYAGTINFFDTAPGHARERRLNITQKLKALAAEGLLSSTPTVTVVAGAPPRAEAYIGSVVIETEED